MGRWTHRSNQFGMTDCNCRDRHCLRFEMYSVVFCLWQRENGLLSLLSSATTTLGICFRCVFLIFKVTRYSLVFETDRDVDSESEPHHASTQNLSSPCTPIYWEIADYSDCRKSGLESTGIFTRCVFSKSQKSRHHSEGDCKRPLSLLTPLSPKECRVAWAYSIASHWVSFHWAYTHHYLISPILQLFQQLRVREIKDDMDMFSHAEQDDDGTPYSRCCYSRV